MMLDRIGRSLIATALVALVAGGLTAPARASTPVPGANAQPVTPDPAQCPVTHPPTIQDLLARIGATPIPAGAQSGEEAPTTTPFTVPAGMPADAATTHAVTAALVQVLACLNTGDFLKALALATDNYLRRIEAVSPLTAVQVAYLERTPAALPPDQYSTLVAVEQALVLADGRVGLVVEVIFPAAVGAPETAWMVFTQVGGTWFLDDEVDHLVASTGAMATPAA